MSDEVEFAALTGLISRETGFALDAYKDKCLRRRIAVRMRACGVHTYGDYRSVLSRTPSELERLRDALTINVTRFYRNRETWDALRTRFLPPLWEARDGRLDVWSAGCSSGEEPYTVAMLVAALCEERGRSAWLDRLTIDATDVDRESMARAQGGTYQREAFQETPADLVDRFTQAASLGLAIVPELRRRVRIRELDLTAAPIATPTYDLVLCRNVVIYFDRPMQERLFSAFADALRPGGILVLGKVETLLGPARERFHLSDARERIYERAA